MARPSAAQKAQQEADAKAQAEAAAEQAEQAATEAKAEGNIEAKADAEAAAEQLQGDAEAHKAHDTPAAAQQPTARDLSKFSTEAPAPAAAPAEEPAAAPAVDEGDRGIRVVVIAAAFRWHEGKKTLLGNQGETMMLSPEAVAHGERFNALRRV